MAGWLSSGESGETITVWSLLLLEALPSVPLVTCVDDIEALSNFACSSQMRVELSVLQCMHGKTGQKDFVGIWGDWDLRLFGVSRIGEVWIEGYQATTPSNLGRYISCELKGRNVESGTRGWE